MSQNVNQSTGPITASGKAISSKNAQKAGIFSKAYLSGEDVELKQAQFESLVNQWGADDPTRILLLRDLEQVTLSMERMMHAECLRLEGVMVSVDMAHEFIRRAGLNVIGNSLPTWFFKADDEGQKELALYIDRVQQEALQLKAAYSDELVAQVKTRYPNLFEYVMQKVVSNHSFVMVLGHKFKQSLPTLSLGILSNEISEKYPHHILWARDPVMYQSIVEGIRAEKILAAMDLDKTIRYATSFQNRKMRTIQALIGMDQRDLTIQSAQKTITMTPSSPHNPKGLHSQLPPEDPMEDAAVPV